MGDTANGLARWPTEKAHTFPKLADWIIVLLYTRVESTRKFRNLHIIQGHINYSVILQLSQWVIWTNSHTLETCNLMIYYGFRWHSLAVINYFGLRLNCYHHKINIILEMTTFFCWIYFCLCHRFRNISVFFNEIRIPTRWHSSMLFVNVASFIQSEFYFFFWREDDKSSVNIRILIRAIHETRYGHMHIYNGIHLND